MSYLKQIRDAVWSHPRPQLAAAGIRGELLVARIRFWLAGVLLLIPLANVVFGSNLRESLVGFGVIFSVFSISLIAYILTARDYHPAWLGFATACFDVTLISAALTAFFLFGQPHTAVNSKVIFEGYFLAFAATTLRYDKRVCVVAGLLALTEYFAIVMFAATRYDLNNRAYAPFAYGMFSWTAQISRLTLMLTAALLTLAVVSRTQELMQLSTNDPLTSLFNRGYFGERFEIEVSRAKRYHQPLTIAMIDVDHFKSFNDQHGHAAGDMVLQMIGEMLRRSFRKSDIVARYGGEEFIIAMPETNADAAIQKLEDFRRRIAGNPIQAPGASKTVYITISAGLAGFPDDGANDDALIKVADTRLFQAKRSGRNQIVRGSPL